MCLLKAFYELCISKEAPGELFSKFFLAIEFHCLADAQRYWLLLFFPCLAAASASSASALCPHVVDPTLIKNIMQCPLAEQCSSDSACPSSRKCCLSFQARGNISAPSLCVGMGCVCPNITSLCPTLECQQYRLDSTGCSICQCASTSGETYLNGAKRHLCGIVFTRALGRAPSWVSLV